MTDTEQTFEHPAMIYASGYLPNGESIYMWRQLEDPIHQEMGGHTGEYSAVYSGSGLVVQERIGWGDEPAPQFRVLVDLGRESYSAYASDLPAAMDLVRQWAPAMVALRQLQE